jgi:hypothetical protein
MNRDVSRSGGAHRLRLSETSHPVVLLFQRAYDLWRFIRRTIIDNNQFEIAVRLRQDRSRRFAKKRRSIVSG